MNTTIIVVVLIGAGLLAYLAYNSLKAARIRSQTGSLRVELDDNIKASGDVSGRIYIISKKPFKSEGMFARLAGTTDSFQIIDNEDGDDSGESQYENVEEEFYSQTFQLAGAASYSPDNTDAIPFSIPFPSETEFRSSAHTVGGKSYRALTIFSGRSDWEVHITLDIPGLNFHDSSAFNVIGEPVESKS